VCLLAVAALAGAPVARQRTDHPGRSAAGYPPVPPDPQRQNNDPNTAVHPGVLRRGTRAAAFSYGVLEELRRTEIVIGRPAPPADRRGRSRDRVSGGSFTALSYALYGEGCSRVRGPFLKRNVQGAPDPARP